VNVGPLVGTLCGRDVWCNEIIPVGIRRDEIWVLVGGCWHQHRHGETWPVRITNWSFQLPFTSGSSLLWTAFYHLPALLAVFPIPASHWNKTERMLWLHSVLSIKICDRLWKCSGRLWFLELFCKLGVLRLSLTGWQTMDTSSWYLTVDG